MILIIDVNREDLARDQFVNPIATIARQAGDVRVRHYRELHPTDIRDASHIIISGTPLMDNDFLDHVEAFSWLKDTNKPVLGICAGMQIIAKMHGARITPQKEIGMIKVTAVASNPLFAGSFEAYALHGNAIVSSGLEVLAESDKCVQAIRSGNQLGILFHPEVRNAEIILAFLGKAPLYRQANI